MCKRESACCCLSFPLFVHLSFSPSKFSVTNFSSSLRASLQILYTHWEWLRGLQSWNLVHTWTVGWCIICTWIRLLVLIYSFISSIFFLSNSKTLNFLSRFSVRLTELKLDIHMGNGLIYCVHKIQAARIYLFLYFASFFCLSSKQRLKTCI